VELGFASAELFDWSASPAIAAEPVFRKSLRSIVISRFEIRFKKSGPVFQKESSIASVCMLAAR
jgi:hypothetical protein